MEIIISKNYYPIDIKKAEEKYNAIYIGDFCLKDRSGNWREKPSAIFYAKDPDRNKGHTNYLGLHLTYKIVEEEMIIDKMYITNGESAFEEPLVGLQTKNGDILISCYRHHYNEKDGEFIDGGRDYQRYSPPATFVNIGIKEDKLIVIN